MLHHPFPPGFAFLSQSLGASAYQHIPLGEHKERRVSRSEKYEGSQLASREIQKRKEVSSPYDTRVALPKRCLFLTCRSTSPSFKATGQFIVQERKVQAFPYIMSYG